jgi:predicted secreted protein
MAKIRFFPALLIMILLFPVQACNNSSSKQEGAVFKKLPEIQEIKPQKPVKIKLKRNASGNYSWELSGNDADIVLKADKQLREALE